MIQKRSPSKLIMSVIIYVIGLFFLAMGVAFSLNAQLGISPVNSLPYVVSNILGQDLGTCVVAVFSIYIVGQIVILRREFQWINLTQLIFSTLFGQFADLGKRILGDFTIPTYGGQLIMLAISIVFIALGVVFYIEASLVPMPMEGMTLAIAKKVNKPFPTVKIVVDCVSVSIGILLSLIFLGRVDGIREGTVITAILAGKVVAILRKPLVNPLRALCLDTPPTDSK